MRAQWVMPVCFVALTLVSPASAQMSSQIEHPFVGAMSEVSSPALKARTQNLMLTV
jgi:hypothetical protein